MPDGGGLLRTYRSRPKQGGWTPISNEYVARNYTLSLKAKGLLLTLLSYPDDADMTTERLVDIHAKAGGKGEGEYAVRAALKELREAGLVAHVRVKGKDGKWRTTTAVSDTPQGLLLLLSPPSPR